jgi:L-iditol 2-dehydrogenase
VRAVVRDASGVTLREVARPGASPGWLRLRVLLSGICRTDVYAADGLFPLTEARTLGHELVGEVLEESGSFARGERVTVSPLLPCGKCAACARNAGCHEPRMLGVDVDGAFADEVSVPLSNAFRVPDGLPLRRAAYVEPIAASLAVTRAHIQPSDRGVILGSGRIASLTLAVLRAKGFDRVALATPSECPTDVDFAVETNASAEVLSAALRAVKPGGVIVWKSRPAKPVPFDLGYAVRKGVTIDAVGYGPFEEAVALAGSLPIDDLLGDVFPLSRFEVALARARSEPMAPKLFLTPNAEG